MSFESFDTKFSRVACVVFGLRQNRNFTPPGQEKSVFQKIFCNGFLCRFVLCKLYKVRVCEKKNVKAGHPNVLTTLDIHFVTLKQL